LATDAVVGIDAEDCDFLNTMAERSMRGWGEERVREMCARARVDILGLVDMFLACVFKGSVYLVEFRLDGTAYGG
jgi:hypothetical protein